MSKVLGLVQSTSADSAPATYALIDNMVLTRTVDNSDSVILLTFAMSPDDPQADETAKYRFTIDGSATGTPETSCMADGNARRVGEASLIWAVDGVSAGSHTFRVEWEIISGAPNTATDQRRMFQVTELTDAVLKVDIDATDVVADPATFTDLHSSTFPVASSALHLLIFVTAGGDSVGDVGDSCSEFRFAIDDVLSGPFSHQDINDLDEATGCGMLWAKTGLSGSTEFAIKWKARLGAGDTSALNRKFQVVEVSNNFDLQTDVELTSAQTSPSPEALMTGMTGTITPDSIDSVVLVASVGTPQDESGATGTEPSCMHRLFRDSSTIDSARILTFSDQTDRTGSFCLIHVKDQVTGSDVYEHRWLNTRSTPILDTARERTFQIIEFKLGVAAIGLDTWSPPVNRLVPQRQSVIGYF